MPMQMNWAGVAVDVDGTTHQNVQVVVRKGEARVSDLGRVDESKPGVIAVDLVDPTNASITFDDGTVWAVRKAPRKKGCGCG
jgi:outer membrane lipoprotein-sorting protein